MASPTAKEAPKEKEAFGAAPLVESEKEERQRIQDRMNVKYTIANDLLYQIDKAKEKYKIKDSTADRIMLGALGKEYPAVKTYGIADGKTKSDLHLFNYIVIQDDPGWKITTAGIRKKSAVWKSSGAAYLKRDALDKLAADYGMVPPYRRNPEQFGEMIAKYAYDVYATQTKFPPYKNSSQDCYTFVTACVYATNMSVDCKEQKDFIGKLETTGWNNKERIYEFGYSLVNASSGKIPWSGLKVGDVLFADKSPNLTGHNHWGIVAKDEKGNLCVIHRSGKNVPLKNDTTWFYRAGGVMSVFRPCGLGSG